MPTKRSDGDAEWQAFWLFNYRPVALAAKLVATGFGAPAPSRVVVDESTEFRTITAEQWASLEKLIEARKAQPQQ